MQESHSSTIGSENVSPMFSHEAIAQCAEELWVCYGRPVGRDLAIWLEAERKLSSAMRKPQDEKSGSATPAGRTKPKSSRQ